MSRLASPAARAGGLSIVVVTWRSTEHLAALVDSMNRELVASPELVVVENASGEDPEPVARRWRGPVEVVREPRNVGFGAACNHGVAVASGEAVVLLNPDTVLLDDGLERLAAFALAADAIAGPRLLEPDGRTQPSASGPVSGPWPWLRALLPGALHPPALRVRTEAWRARHAVRVCWLTGACLAAPRAALERLGPFDPAIELFAEDLDLGLRAEAAGVPRWFRPDLCSIVHRGSGSTEIRFAQREAMELAARYRVAVMRRALGTRRERRAAGAEALHLALRALAKRPIDADAARRDAALLAAARAARGTPALPPFEAGG